MNFQLMIQLIVFGLLIIRQCGSLTLTCNTTKPKDQDTLLCTCTNPTKNGVEWRKGSTVATSCAGGTDSCFPVIPEYTSDVSKDEFYMEIDQYSYTDCATYSCKDTTTGEEKPVTTYIADFDTNSIVALEPGANTTGQVNITTGCVFPPDDIEITWYIIKAGVADQCREEKLDADVSFERSTCSNTCGTLEDKKVVSGFTHTEYDEEKNGDFKIVEAEYRVVVSHKSYATDIFSWTSAKYHSTGWKLILKILAILSTVFGIPGTGLLTFCVFAVVKRLLSKKLILALIAVDIVLYIISLGLGASVLADEDWDCCPDWIKGLATTFTVIPSLGIIVGIIIGVLVILGVIKVKEADKGKTPAETQEMTITRNENEKTSL